MEGRHDPYFYLPRFVRLEAHVLARSTAKLRDYVLAMAGGATPKKEEEEKYYSDIEGGVPFVRVQNLNTSGELTLEDVKYVNIDTHRGLLGRSQVLQDDLLVKITGVGRMAVASVPPLGFEGNINQHIVRIRTKDRDTSTALAAWLNTDIAESLAKRRATGGTRPALDYPALRSIPVILDERLQRALADAHSKYKVAIAKADGLLGSIDSYLMSELGITLPPEQEDSIVNRIFTAELRDLTGWRFDARVHRHEFSFATDRYPCVPLKTVVHVNPRTSFTGVSESTLLTFVPMEAISDIDGTITASQERPFSENVGYTDFQEGDLLWAKITPCMENGKSAVARNLLKGFGFGSTEFHVLRPCGDLVAVDYLHALLRMKRVRMAAASFFGGSSGHQRVDESFFYRLDIPLPGIEVQKRLATHISLMRRQAKELRFRAKTELEKTKQEIEINLIGEMVP